MVCVRSKTQIHAPWNGETESIFSAGDFELWRTRAYYAWDLRTKERVPMPSMYRIVKRVEGNTYFVMRELEAGADWREVSEELAEQTMLLCYRNTPKGRRK